MPSLTEDQCNSISQDGWDVWYESCDINDREYTESETAYLTSLRTAINTFGDRS